VEYRLENDTIEPEIRCNYCGERAVFETVINGIYVCDEDNCLLELVRNECLAEEITDQDHLDYGVLLDEDAEDVF
jgi:hypothetical protein